MPRITRQDQKRIITELCDYMKTYLLARADRIPEEWDGLELREWFSQQAHYEAAGRLTGTRLRECRNEIIVRNL